jgi:O-antigen/teichoic acid export membrane protein
MSAETRLRRKIFTGSALTIGAYGASQLMRLASNLVLTRLLFPAAFGIMGIVAVVLQGLQMFSDLGVTSAVVRHPRGDDEEFLRTAWSVQLSRSFVVYGLVVLSAYPVSRFYRMPELMALLPVSGLSVIITGLASTALITKNRKLELGPLTAIELGTQALGVGVTIALAWWRPSVWSLVAGSLVGVLAKTVLSHAVLPGIVHRFRVNRDYAQEVIKFGRWILLSSALTFIVAQGDRAVLGRLLTPAQLGVYSVAFFLSQAVVEVVRSIGARVLFPVYAKLSADKPGNLRRAVRRARTALLAVFLPGVCILTLFGPWIVRLLYDARYADAGWMLQILSVGSIGSILSLTSNSVLLSVGDSFRYAVVLAFRSVLLIAGMLIGSRLGVAYLSGPDRHIQGLLWGFVASSFLNYPVLAWAIKKYDVWFPFIDLLALAVCAAIILAGFALF